MPLATGARREEPDARNALSNAPRLSPRRAISTSAPSSAAASLAPARPPRAGSRKGERRTAPAEPERNAATPRQGAAGRRPARIEVRRRPRPRHIESCAGRPPHA